MNQSTSSAMDRRSFAKRTAIAVAAGYAASTGVTKNQERGRPLRLSLVSAASYGRPGQERRSGSNHGTAFATTFNGWNASKASLFEGVFVKSQRRLNSARVVKVWDPDSKAAIKMAEACNIESVSNTPEECSHDVDAVIIIDDGTGAHWKYAVDPLRKGVPTFCDKPLAMTAREAAAMADLARKCKTPFMSASSLRFVPDIVKLRDELSELGEVYLAHAICGNDLIYYGIHALSMVYAVLGSGAISAINVGRSDANIARIRFAKDLDVMLTVAESPKMKAGYQLNLYGTKAWRNVTPDLSNLYSYLLEAFIDYVVTGKECVPIEEEVEVIAALEAAQKSLVLKREILVKEMFSE